MRLFSALLASAALMGLSVAAHATTGTTFNIDGTLSGTDLVFAGGPPVPVPRHGSFSGTVVIDTASYLALSENITVSISDGGSYTFNHSLPSLDPLTFVGGEDGTFVNDGRTSVNDYQGGLEFGFSFADPASGAYAGGALINPALLTFGPNGVDSGSGTLVNPNALPVSAATPEPSSLILLGTGLLGAVGAARRRILNR